MIAYKHIIWDWNGTLLDDTWLCLEIMNEQCKKIGRPPVSYDMYREIFDFPVRGFYEKIGFDFSKVSYETVAQYFIGEYTRRRFECSLHFGVHAVLAKLKGLGCDHAILSAYAKNVLLEMVDHHKLSFFFTHIAGQDNHYASGKIEEGKALLAELDAPVSGLVLVGDTVHDYAVARTLGIDVILIGQGHNSILRLNTCGVPVVSCFSEALLHIVK